jgi:phosphate transport system substrate-binding protein
MKINLNHLLKSNSFYILLPLLFVLISCNYNPRANMNKETLTRGKIKISVDESFRLLLDTELYTFHAIYRNAHITPQYKPTIDVLNDLLDDSVQTVISTINLTKDEVDFLRQKQIVAHTTVIAYDALALITNRNNPDSFLLSTDVKKIMTGVVTNWNQIQKKNNSGNIKVIFDNLKSGNILYFVDKYNLDSILPKNFFAAQSNEEVISYVEKNQGAIGILSVNWISDKHDTVSQKFLSEIRVMAVSPEFDPENGTFTRPYQAYIADKSYPYIREVYMICRETFYGLGTGFTSFVAGEKGQRIILKSKLVPATMPVRIVQIKNQ